ncbi:MAG: hypothetical protein P8L77_03480 [Gammaproteobacteria bacterium]|nr:hypothetical protein [Gammaproteobacteria bacterium]
MVISHHKSEKKRTQNLGNVEVTLLESRNPTEGFKRDVIFNINDLPTKLFQKIGVIRSSDNPVHILDELIWLLGTHTLKLHEDYPEIFHQNIYCVDLLKNLQNELDDLKEESIKKQLDEEPSKQTLFKYFLIDLIRNFIEKNDKNQTDEIYIINAVDHAFKASLNFVDDYEFKKVSVLEVPKNSISLNALHKDGHLADINNQTANTILKFIDKEQTIEPAPEPKERSWLYNKPTWLPFISYKGLLNIGVTASLTMILLFLSKNLSAIQHFASAFSISNPFFAASFLATLIILGITYLTQLTPKNTLTLSEFILKSMKSFMTMLTCLLVLIHFFYPYNILNMAFYHLFNGMLTLALSSSLHILATIVIFIIVNQILTVFAEPEKDHNFPTKWQPLKFSEFLLFRTPYRNVTWRFFQTKENRQFLYIFIASILVIAAVSIYQHSLVLGLISSIATIFSISSIMAILVIISLAIFCTKLKDIVKLYKARRNKKTNESQASNLDKFGMIFGFFGVMSYILYLDFSVISGFFSIIGNIFSINAPIILLSSQAFLLGSLLIVPFLLPKTINIKGFFYNNPFLQAEHIFMELNEFYYLYGLRHPIIMMLFLGLFIMSFASFYNHFIPAIIADFAHTLAIALINTNVGTSLLAFTASMMIGNILIIAYDSLTAGKRSYIARLSQLWEMYPLDVLAFTILTLLTLNLFILVPYIQTHLGTVAMIGSLSFLFKICVISYDFYRDNTQKSFIASALMMLLWPFLAIRQLINEPSIDQFYHMARDLERSIIFFLLTVLYDVPFKIILRISEVMVYAVFNITISITKGYGLDECTTYLVQTKKNVFSYIDFFRISAKTTIFTNRQHYRLWHLMLVVGLIWLSFHFITLGLGTINTAPLIIQGHWFAPSHILHNAIHNSFVHSIIFIQLGWTIMSALTLGLIRLTNFTHKDIEFEKYKEDFIEICKNLLTCTTMFSLACILLCAFNFSFIPTFQLVLLCLSIAIQYTICYSDYADGLYKMMQHCFKANEHTILSSENIRRAFVESPVKHQNDNKTTDLAEKEQCPLSEETLSH